MEIEGLLIPFTLIFLWIMAFRFTSRSFGAAGRNQFWFFLIGAIAISILLFLLIVVPQFDCEGGLCILGPVLIWGAITLIMHVVLSTVLIVKAYRAGHAKNDKQ